jgi:O-antigen/teichoic acid export membrane protein
MPTKVVNIAKNTSYFTFALILQKVISFTYFAILASHLPPEQLGKYYFAISFTVVVGILLDLGLGNVLMREVAKDNSKAGQLIGGVILIKIPLLFISFGLIATLANVFDYEPLVKLLIYFSALNVALDTFTANFYAVIRGHHKLGFESVGHVIFQLITLCFGLVVLKLDLGLVWLIAALTLASLFNFSYSLTLMLTRFNVRVQFKAAVAPIWSLMLLAIPFSLYAIFQRVYQYLDSVLLKNLAGDEFVGLYQIAFKIIFALQFLPLAFVASLYPAFAKYWKDLQKETPPRPIGHPSKGGGEFGKGTHPTLSGGTPPRGEGNESNLPPMGGVPRRGEGGASPQLLITFERAFNYLLIISAPVTVGVILIAKDIVSIFRPEYLIAVLPLQLIILALPFLFLNYPIGALLNACDRQKRNTIHMGITLAASIALNLFLIPKFTIYGAAATVVITNFLLFSLNFTVVPDIIELRLIKLAKMVGKVLFSALVMGLFVYFANQYLNVFLVVAAAMVVYFVMIFVSGGVKREDVVSVVRSITGGKGDRGDGGNKVNK